jgi:hypothetical protein
MPRRPRLVLPGAPIHLVQRGVDRQACFFDDADRCAYLDWEITIQRGFPGHSSLRHITFQRPWPRAEKSICMSNAKWQA